MNRYIELARELEDALAERNKWKNAYLDIDVQALLAERDDLRKRVEELVALNRIGE